MFLIAVENSGARSRWFDWETLNNRVWVTIKKRTSCQTLDVTIIWYFVLDNPSYSKTSCQTQNFAVVIRYFRHNDPPHSCTPMEGDLEGTFTQKKGFCMSVNRTMDRRWRENVDCAAVELCSNVTVHRPGWVWFWVQCNGKRQTCDGQPRVRSTKKPLCFTRDLNLDRFQCSVGYLLFGRLERDESELETYNVPWKTDLPLFAYSNVGMVVADVWGYVKQSFLQSVLSHQDQRDRLEHSGKRVVSLFRIYTVVCRPTWKQTHSAGDKLLRNDIWTVCFETDLRMSTV